MSELETLPGITVESPMKEVPEPTNVSPSKISQLLGHVDEPGHQDELQLNEEQEKHKPEDVEMKKPDASGVEPETRKRGREDEESVLYVSCPPPVILTEKAIYSRLHRIFKRRKDGSFALDDKWNGMWNDTSGGGRDAMFSMFEKVGYNPDGCAEKWIEIQTNRFVQFWRYSLLGLKLIPTKVKANENTTRRRSANFWYCILIFLLLATGRKSSSRGARRSLSGFQRRSRKSRVSG